MANYVQSRFRAQDMQGFVYRFCREDLLTTATAYTDMDLHAEVALLTMEDRWAYLTEMPGWI